jgi:hypothetical protein
MGKESLWGTNRLPHHSDEPAAGKSGDEGSFEASSAVPGSTLDISPLRVNAPLAMGKQWGIHCEPEWVGRPHCGASWRGL